MKSRANLTKMANLANQEGIMQDMEKRFKNECRKAMVRKAVLYTTLFSVLTALITWLVVNS